MTIVCVDYDGVIYIVNINFILFFHLIQKEVHFKMNKLYR